MRVTAEAKIATRTRILAVATRQFARAGYEATTTRDIAREAEIAVGTLFNYFPTKEAIVEWLVREACARAADEFASRASSDSPSAPSAADLRPTRLEEALFSQAALVLRKLKPYRKYLPAVLDTTFSPLASSATQSEAPALRAAHLETVSQIIARHGLHAELSAVALQLYWTLYTGVLSFWARDGSPRQEDTLALLDESTSMFAGWLTSQRPSNADDS